MIDLHTCLNDYNMDAMELIGTLEKLTQGRYQKEMGELHELVDEFEFDQALKKLNDLNFMQKMLA